MQQTLFGFATEGLVTEQEAIEQVAPYRDDFADLFYGSWTEWHSLDSDTTDKISAMQRGGAIHDIARDRADAAFGDVLEICKRGFWKVYVGDRIVIRLRKLRDDLVAPTKDRSEPTKMYYGNRPMNQVRPGCTRLTAGYALNPIGTEIAGVYLTLQVDEDLVWAHQLDSASHTIGFPQPDAHASPPAPTIALAGHDETATEETA